MHLLIYFAFVHNRTQILYSREVSTQKRYYIHIKANCLIVSQIIWYTQTEAIMLLLYKDIIFRYTIDVGCYGSYWSVDGLHFQMVLQQGSLQVMSFNHFNKTKAFLPSYSEGFGCRLLVLCLAWSCSLLPLF